MAFSVKQIKAVLSEFGMPVENLEKAAEEICGRHSADLDSIKEQRDGYKQDAEKLASVQKELDDLKAKGNGGYEEKFKKLQQDFEAYKADITAKETKAAREAAAKAFFESKHITGANLAIAMRGARDEIAELELDSDGKIKDGSKLEGLVKGEFASLIVTESTRGASTTTPPTNTGGGGKMTKAEILKIKDIGERQAAIAENHELFGF